MPDEVGLTRFVPSNNTGISTALVGLKATFANAARANVQSSIEASGGTDDYTEIEKRAMSAIEELKLINGMDLAAILMRGEIIKQIRDEALFSWHPGHYGTMEEMAQDQGIGKSELSNVCDLCFIIFPFMEDELHMNVADTFERIGKSNMRELVPVMKAIITGNVTTAVQVAVDAQLNDVAATVRVTAEGAGIEPDLSTENLRRLAIDNLITNGQQMTNRDLRETIRPTRTAQPDAITINSGGRRFLIAEMTDEQMVAFGRKVGAWMTPTQIDLPEDPSARRMEAARILVVRRISGLME